MVIYLARLLITMTEIQPDFNNPDSSTDSLTFADLFTAHDESLQASLDVLERLRNTDTSKMTATELKEHQKELQEMEEVVSVLTQMKFESLPELQRQTQEAQQFLTDNYSF